MANSNEDHINERNTIIDIEKIADDRSNINTKLHKKHPMTNVTYDKQLNLYRYHSEDGTIESTKSKEYAINAVFDSWDKTDLIDITSFTKTFFPLMNYYFVVYCHENEPYFDIKHIISVLNLKPKSEKSKNKEYSDMIKHIVYYKNDYDGYSIRKLIGEQTAYEIIFSSNSEFSKLFKKHVTKIMIELRKQDQIVVTNEKVALRKAKREAYQNPIIKEIIENNINYSHLDYTNPVDFQSVILMIKNGSRIQLFEYYKRHVLYAIILPIKTDHTKIIVKFGYSGDIVERFKTLMSGYKCSSIYLIGIKRISGQSKEESFHKHLKTLYPQSIEPFVKENKSYVELYKLSWELINQFNGVTDRNLQNNGSIIFETPDSSFVQNQLITQEKSFINNHLMTYCDYLSNKYDDPEVINNINKNIHTYQQNVYEETMKIHEIELYKEKRKLKELTIKNSRNIKKTKTQKNIVVL